MHRTICNITFSTTIIVVHYICTAVLWFNSIFCTEHCSMVQLEVEKNTQVFCKLKGSAQMLWEKYADHVQYPKNWYCTPCCENLKHICDCIEEWTVLSKVAGKIEEKVAVENMEDNNLLVFQLAGKDELRCDVLRGWVVVWSEFSQAKLWCVLNFSRCDIPEVFSKIILSFFLISKMNNYDATVETSTTHEENLQIRASFSLAGASLTPASTRDLSHKNLEDYWSSPHLMYNYEATVTRHNSV